MVRPQRGQCVSSVSVRVSGSFIALTVTASGSANIGRSVMRNAVRCLLALGRTKLGVSAGGGEVVQAMLASLFVAGLNAQLAPCHSNIIDAALGTIPRI